MLTVTPVASPPIRQGDHVTIDVPIRRKWWQIWRPRFVGFERRDLTIIATYSANGAIEMPFTSPAQVAAAMAEERRLWASRDEAAMDVRIAERDGDGGALVVAEGAREAASKAWYDAHTRAQNAVRAALETIGLDPNQIKPYL